MIAIFLHRNPRVLVLVVAVIVVAGISSFIVMPRLEDPVLGRRVGVLSTVFPGANPERVESLVTVPLEERLHGLSAIKRVRSNSQSGISNIVIELNDDIYAVDPVWARVRNRIAVGTSQLPALCEEPSLQVVPLKAFAAIISVQQLEDSDAQDVMPTRRFAKKLRARLMAIQRTDSVDLFGDPGEEILVEIPPPDLAETGLSTAAIAQQISDSEANLPAGRLPLTEGDLALTLQSEVSAVERIRNSLITKGQRSEAFPLSTIASINKQAVMPPSTEAIINNRGAIVLGAMVSDAMRVDHWADQMQLVLSRFESEFGGAIAVEVLFSQRDHIDLRMKMLLRNLGIGTAAVMLVVLILMGWRSMLVIGVSLPLSACAVLSAMRIMSIPVHQMSVTGLIVALGLLIDNAIVIVEDIRSRILSGTEKSVAIVSGVRRLAMPLFGSTLTTALAFLPIATLPGPPGEFVGTIAVSVILSICASFLLAMTVVPALIGLLKIDSSQTGLLSKGLTSRSLLRIYETSLCMIFRLPVAGVILGLLLPMAGFVAAGRLPEQFFPPSDRSQIQIEVELPEPSGIQVTRETVKRVAAIVADYDQVSHQHWFLGESAPTFFYNVVPRRRGTPFYAQAFVDLTQPEDTGRLVREIQDAIDAEVLRARVIVRQLEQGPPFDAPVEIRLFGEDAVVLQKLGGELRALLGETANVIHTRSDSEETIPALRLQIDELAAQEAGLKKTQLGGLLYTTLEGASGGSVLQDDEEYPVRVKLKLDGKFKLERLAALPLPAPQRAQSNSASSIESSGLSPLTLGSIATWKLAADVGAIVRIDGRRANEIKAYIRAGVLPSTVITEFKRRLRESVFALPEGYELEFGGETEQRSQAVQKLIANGFVLFALIMLTLVASFQSFRCALIVAIVGGLSAGLGPLALAFFGYPFGFMAIVGTMGLVGIAINDSIVVLAAIRSNDAARAGDRNAVREEVLHATRHVVATTLTTIVGFLPLILGGGGFWPPLAITIAGAVAGATLLALYFTPSMYLLVCRPRKNSVAGE